MTKQHLIVVDTETGGFNPAECCIIELAAQHVVIDHEAQSVTAVEFAGFHALIKPSRPVGEQAASVNGYTEDKWRGSHALNEVAIKFLTWLIEDIPHEGLIWTGSNVLGFDLPFLRSDLARVDLKLPGKPKFERRTLNTESLCFPLLVAGEVESCGIQALRNWAGIEGKQRHNALSDVADTVHVIRTYFERKVWA